MRKSIYSWLSFLTLLLFISVGCSEQASITGTQNEKASQIVTPPIALSATTTVSAGTSSDLDYYTAPYGYSLPLGKSADDIVGMAIAPSTSRVYTWYDDREVSSGNTADLDKYAAPYGYSLPPGYDPEDIVAMAIAKSTSRVYVWYSNGKVSSGNTADLDYYTSPTNYTVPTGYTASQIRGAAIAPNDRVYIWYSNYNVSSGTTTDLDYYSSPYGYSVAAGGYTQANIVGLGIAPGTSRCYAWYNQ